MAIMKTILRTGVILGTLAVLGLGGMALVAGPDRACAVIDQVQASIRSSIDDNVEDTVALRNQLRKLQSEYPERISQVRADLAEIQEEIRELERDKAISQRVVSLADQDLAVLEPLLTDAGAGGNVQTSTVLFQNRLMSLNQAYTRATQIKQTRIAYANRGADADYSLGYLHQQAERLAQLLVELEAERAEFETQLVQLDRQVDAIARNERLISMMEKRQKSFEASRYEAPSMDHIVARLGEIRTRQEAEIDYLANDQRRIDYEDLARMQLESERQPGSAVDAAPQPFDYTHELTPVR